jgi:hypothetical protein
MEDILLERVNMRAIMSDLVLRDTLDTSKSIRGLCILSQYRHVKTQGLGQRRSAQALVNWNVSRLPTKVDSTDFGSVATWQIPGDAHNSSQGCSWLEQSQKSCTSLATRLDIPAQVNSAILKHVAVVGSGTEAWAELTFDWTRKSVGKGSGCSTVHLSFQCTCSRKSVVRAWYGWGFRKFEYGESTSAQGPTYQSITQGNEQRALPSRSIELRWQGLPQACSSASHICSPSLCSADW